MPTTAGVSPSVPRRDRAHLADRASHSCTAHLAVVEVGLLVRAIRIGPPETVADPFAADHDGDTGAGAERPLTFAY